MIFFIFYSRFTSFVVTAMNCSEYGNIENVDPEILKLLQYDTLTVKGNPRRRI